MKDKIMGHPFIRWAVNLHICKWAASNPFLSHFCNYEVISYLICGILTTIVDYAVYFVSRTFNINIAAATTISWLAAVIFAYFVNKIFVFFSTDWTVSGLLAEFIPFITCRILSYFMNLLFMLITVNMLSWNEALMKIICSIFVMVVNYFGSKFFAFRKDKRRSI